MKKLIPLMLIIFTSPAVCLSQDIRGGEMTYSHITGFTYSFDIYLYTQTSMGISHANILISTGDGNTNTVTGAQIILPNDITVWHYTSAHTYSNYGSYSVSALDSFRIASIQNISNSSLEHIFLLSQVNISPFIGSNSNPVFMKGQTRVINTGSYFIHDPAASDPDGDSLEFSLVPASASNYVYPPGAVIDSITGIFQMPVTSGIYAINIKTDEWRSGTVIATTYREMVIDSNAVVGIDPVAIEDVNFTVYPNPFTDELSITVKRQNFKQADFIITNDLGQNVFRKQVNNISSFYTETIELGSLANGIYLLDANIDGERTVTKLVKCD